MTDPIDQRIRPVPIEDELRSRLPRLRHERHRQPRAAGCPRWPQAGPSARAVHDARDGSELHRELSQVRRDRRRGDGQVPPARRPVAVRRARAPRPGLLAALPARGRPGQLRLRRRRPARRHALHGSAHDRHRLGAARRHRQGHRRVRGELRRHPGCSRRCCPRSCPTCSSTAPRASRWAWPPTSRPTTWARSPGPPTRSSRTPTLPPTSCASTCWAQTSRPAPRSSGSRSGATPSPASANASTPSGTCTPTVEVAS